MDRTTLKSQGRLLFKTVSAKIPSSPDIISEATLEIMASLSSADEVKAKFSSIVSLVQARAYEIYQQKEAAACAEGIRSFLDQANTSLFNEDNFVVLDAFFLSLVQSRKPRAGNAFEAIVTTLFQKLEYPFSAQPNLGRSKPDFVLPSLECYEHFAADCIIFTCKRTLRERWRQVLTEGISGKAFYLATMDESISVAELERIKGQSVYLVVPATLKANNYSSVPNVITFEVFLQDHLDPSIQKWTTAGLI